MSKKLTSRQVEVLQAITTHRVYFFQAWDLGTPTCEALRKRGLVSHGEGDRPFTTGLRNNEHVVITDAGRAALASPAPKGEA